MKDNIESHIDIAETLETAETLYSINSLKTEFTVIGIYQNGFIAYKEHTDIWLDFYIFQFYSGSESDSYIQLIWCGSGTKGNLRELRHSYFSEYVFYINLNLINKSSKWLQQHFD